jgi:ubiquinone/menaquinone biosynthesis C-methylase UbiE
MDRMLTNELPTSETEVREFWDSAAPTYDTFAGHGLFADVEREAWCRLLQRILGDEPRRVLDVGTGTGFLALRAAELGHDVTGIDISDAMLAQAETAAARAGVSVRLVACSSELDAVAGMTFDAIVCRHLVWTLPQPEGTLRRWREVLPDQGRIVAIDGTWFPTRGVDRALARTGRALRRLSRKPHKHASGLYDARGPERFPLAVMRSPEPLHNCFERAGLQRVRSEYLDGIDAVERSVMPFADRLANRWRRFLVEGSA